jgi:hypothetical protein
LVISKWCDKFAIDIIIGKVKLLIQAPRAQSVPPPTIIPPKLDFGKTPDKALSAVAASPTSSSASMTKKEKKKALLKAMIESYKEDIIFFLC